jgi:hypothetical protein
MIRSSLGSAAAFRRGAILRIIKYVNIPMPKIRIKTEKITAGMPKKDASAGEIKAVPISVALSFPHTLWQAAIGVLNE